MYNNLLVPSREMPINKNIFILVKKQAFNHNLIMIKNKTANRAA